MIKSATWLLLIIAPFFLGMSVASAADYSNGLPEAPIPSGVQKSLPKPGSGATVTNDTAVGSAEWLEKALARNDVQAVVAAGSNYLFGTGVREDDQRAIALIICAVISGDSEARRLMGFVYASGSGVPQDLYKSIDWYESAAREGNAKAQLNLGEMFSLLSPPDVTNAVLWISRSAERGYAPAQYDLGTMYENGVGVKLDLVKALAWLQLAADGGNVKAIKERDLLASTMNSDQKRQAELQAKSFKPVPSKSIADDKGVATCRLDDDFRIAVKLFGKTRYLVPDTGAPFTLFDNHYTNLLGEGLVDMNSPTMNAMLYTGPEFFIGQRRFSPLMVSVFDTGTMQEITGGQIDGILGLDCLTNCVVTFNSDQGVFSIGGSVPESMKEHAMALPLVEAKGGGVAIEAFVNGSGPIRLRIDSGNNGSISLDEADWKKVFPAGATHFRSAKHLNIGPHMEEIIEERESARLRAMSIGTNHYTNLIADSSGPRLPSSLGQGFIWRHVCTIDFPNRLLYLLRGGNFDKPDETDMSGLSFLVKEGEIVVDSVGKGSPAFIAGVTTGDKLITVNGQKAPLMGISDIEKMLKANPDDRIEMQVMHQGITKTFVFTLKRLL